MLQDGPGALSLFCLRWRWDVLRVRVLLVPTRTLFIVSFPKPAPPPIFSSCGMAPVCCIATPPTTQLLDGARRCSVECVACARLAHPHVNNVFFFFLFSFRCPKPTSAFKLQDGPGVCHCCCCRVHRCFAHWVQSARWAAMVQASLLVCLHGLAA